jgi:acyl-coenzyme A thioesterase PaaI-like protein
LRQLTISSTHQGPFGAANGGYVAGILADALGGAPTNVRIRKPVPLDTPIYLARRIDSALLRHEDQTIASAEMIDDEIPEASFVSAEEALAGERAQLDLGMFASCFVCGIGAPGGLGIDPLRLEDNRFAAVWRPADSDLVAPGPVAESYLRSALDCPGGFAAIHSSQMLAVTGTLTTKVNFRPDAGERLIVVGEATWSEGRKLGAVTTLFTESAEVVATASAVWVTLAPVPGVLTAAVA